MALSTSMQGFTFALFCAHDLFTGIFRSAPGVPRFNNHRALKRYLELGADPNIIIYRLRFEDLEQLTLHVLAQNEDNISSAQFLEEEYLRFLDPLLPVIAETLLEIASQALKIGHFEIESILCPVSRAAFGLDYEMLCLLDKYGGNFNKALSRIPKHDRLSRYLANPLIAIWSEPYSEVLDKVLELIVPGEPVLSDWIWDCVAHALNFSHKSRLSLQRLFLLFHSACGEPYFNAPVASGLFKERLKHQHIARDRHGSTVLHMLVHSASVAVCEELIIEGANVNAVDAHGMTPLLDAVVSGRAEMIECLLRNGASISHQARPRTFMHSLLSRSDSHVWYITRNYDAQRYMTKGWSALHIATSRDLLDIAKLLIEKGLDPLIRDDSGDTAKDLAKKDANNEFACLLSFYECGSHPEYVEQQLQSRTLSKGLLQLEHFSRFPMDSEHMMRCPGYCQAFFRWESAPSSQDMACSICHLIRESFLGDGNPIPKAAYVIRADTAKHFLRINCIDAPLEHPIRRIPDEWSEFLASHAMEENDSTGSDIAFAMASRWLESCLDDHKQCKSQASHQFSPTRVLEICSADKLEVKLTESESIEEPYVALNHRWGTDDLLGTTRVNLPQRRHAIPEAELTEVMKEAIVITQRLGYRYIWIDALCIVQDCEEDWLFEASRMSQVFSGAIVTLAAADANEHSKGIFRKRRGRCVLPFKVPNLNCSAEWRNEEGNGEGSFHVFPNTPFMSAGKRPRGPLDTRAWILQEQLLSPRILYFGDGEIFWDCMTVSASESSPISASLLFDDNPDETWALKTLRKVLLGSTDQAIIRTRLAEVWTQAIKNYSNRRLTKETDKIIALDGVIQPLASILKEPPVAGMWHSSLWRQLIWWNMQPGTRDVFMAPTWSWLSASGPVSYHNSLADDDKSKQTAPTNLNLTDLEPHIEVIAVETEALPGAVGIRGTLTLFGLSFPYRLTENDFKKSIHKRWKASKLNLNPGKWLLDGPQELPIDIHCLIVAEDTVKKMSICMCLVQDQEDLEKWHRVGLCHWEGLLWQISKYVDIEPEDSVFQIV